MKRAITKKDILPITNQKIGEIGEKEVVKYIPCPNCGKKLQRLLVGAPLCDVSCHGCLFRAQVKTSLSKPKSVIRGAGWDIVEKSFKSGAVPTFLFLNFKWVENAKRNQEIRFYPFVPRKHFKKYTLSDKAQRANYKMFHYVDMTDVPYFVYTLK